MHDPANEVPRIYLPRTPVNTGKGKGKESAGISGLCSSETERAQQEGGSLKGLISRASAPLLPRTVRNSNGRPDSSSAGSHSRSARQKNRSPPEGLSMNP